MRRAEQLHEEILAQMDLSKEASDEELLELIHRILEEKSKEEFIPLGEKAILGRELFNAFRKLDILQELIEDEKITEIMESGTAVEEFIICVSGADGSRGTVVFIILQIMVTATISHLHAVGLNGAFIPCRYQK